MRRTQAALAAASLILGLAAATPAFAGQTGTIRLRADYSGSDAYSANRGGEFRVDLFTGLNLPGVGPDVAVNGSYFQTFCLEYNEYIGFGKVYQWELSTATDAGGVSGGQPDPLDARTAYLYTKFWSGTLGNYEYQDFGTASDERAGSAGQLQNAFWYLEGEISSLNHSSQAWAWVQEAQHAVDNGLWSGIGSVRVLNITERLSDGSIVKRQDQLVIVPLPPAAAAGMLLLGGLGALRRFRRRKTS